MRVQSECGCHAYVALEGGLTGKRVAARLDLPLKAQIEQAKISSRVEGYDGLCAIAM